MKALALAAVGLLPLLARPQPAQAVAVFPEGSDENSRLNNISNAAVASFASLPAWACPDPCAA